LVRQAVKKRTNMTFRNNEFVGAGFSNAAFKRRERICGGTR